MFLVCCFDIFVKYFWRYKEGVSSEFYSFFKLFCFFLSKYKCIFVFLQKFKHKSMKQLFKTIAFFAILSINNNTFAQTQEQKAQDILVRVEQKFKETSALKAKFSYEISNPANKTQDAVKGEFVMKKNKFRLKLTKLVNTKEVTDQEVINNGKTVWTYLKESNEVNISDYTPEDSEITPDKVFTLYKKDYKYSLIEEVTEGKKTYQIIDLQPIDKNKKHFKIRLKINKATNSVKSWEIFEKNQNRFKYTISEIAYQIEVGDNYFNFNKSSYPGVVENDMR